MTTGLDDILREFPYEPGRLNARLATAADGREVVQIRVELGILQMECGGRPDGGPSLLEAAEASEAPLARIEAAALRLELVQHHQRAVAFLTLGDPRRALADADVVLLVVDALNSVPVHSSDLFAELQQQVGSRLTVILNKIDLLAEQPRSAMHGDIPCLHLSAHTGAGLGLLTEHLKQRAGFNPAEDAGFIARRRHLAALEQAEKGLVAARHCLQDLRAGELVAEELRKVQLALDEITGKFSSDDLLGQIFGSFCIGK